MKASKLRVIAVSFLGAVSLAHGQVLTPTSAEQVTDADIAAVQATMEQGCVSRGLERQAPEVEVRGFCSCITQVMKAQVSKPEWQQAVVAAAAHDNAGLQRALGGHMEQMAACKKN